MKGYVLVAVAFIACFALAFADPTAELKDYEDKLQAAKKSLAEAQTFLQSDYIQNFGKILEGGVEKLDQSTMAQLKTETDAAKRTEVITYASKAYVRLVKFLDEIKNIIQ